MGKDGTKGLLALRKRNWYTIAQDWDSSIMHGMRKAAAQLGATSDILPSNMIGGAINDFLFEKRRKSYE